MRSMAFKVKLDYLDHYSHLIWFDFGRLFCVMKNPVVYCAPGFSVWLVLIWGHLTLSSALRCSERT